jgi:magnesium chelatase subunit I
LAIGILDYKQLKNHLIITLPKTQMTATLSAPPKTRRVVFPFTAIVGQEEMKLALLLNVIDPKIGGVMIMGDRGTGKSTTIRALADLLPEIEVVANDPFNSHPTDPDLMSDQVRSQVDNQIPLTVVQKKVTMVDLPLGATEDRVCGTIILKKLSRKGLKPLNLDCWPKLIGAFSTWMKLTCSMIT